MGGDSADAKLVAEDTQVIAIGLLNCYMGSDLIELHGMPINFVKQISATPTATPMARMQATKSATVTNRRHEVVRLNDLDRHLVPLLDGKHDKAALVEKLTVIAQSGALNVQRDGLTLYDANEIQQALNAIIEQAIGNVARMALLVS